MTTATVSTRKLADGTTRWDVGGFFATLRVLGPGVVYTTAVGSGEHIFIHELAQALEAELASHGRVVVFVNLLEAARFGGAARDSWSEWSKQHKRNMSARFLVRSRLVEMGLSLIAMFSGAELRSYTDDERFLAAMRLAAPNAVLPNLRDLT